MLTMRNIWDIRLILTGDKHQIPSTSPEFINKEMTEQWCGASSVQNRLYCFTDC